MSEGVWWVIRADVPFQGTGDYEAKGTSAGEAVQALGLPSDTNILSCRRRSEWLAEAGSSEETEIAAQIALGEIKRGC